MAPLNDIADRFFVFEGVHGSGKSTQIGLLQTRLRRDGISSLVTKEAQGTILARRLYAIIKNHDCGVSTSPLLAALLFTAARASRVREVIVPALTSGRVVLSDRYEATMRVTQGACLGVASGVIETLNRAATEGVNPRLTVLLDVTLAEAKRRREARAKPSIWDQLGAEFHKKARREYLKIANSEEAWVIVDSTRPASQVADEIYRIIAPLVISTR